MDLREKIEKGILSDYVLHIEYFTKNDKMNHLIEIVKQNVMWAPFIVYFNSNEKAIEFTSLLNRYGITSDYFGKNCDISKKNKVLELLRNYKLIVLCVSYDLEDISINEAQTIIFGDVKLSNKNEIDLIEKVSAKCSTKPFFRIILPISNNDFKENYLKIFMNDLILIDTKLKNFIEEKKMTRIRISQNRKNVKSSKDYEKILKKINNLIDK